jgi:hypothetical protein
MAISRSQSEAIGLTPSGSPWRGSTTFASNSAESYDVADRNVVKAACDILKSCETDAMFVYLGSVDATGHTRGFHPAVKPCIAAIEQADQRVGRLLNAIRARERYARERYNDEKWLVVICTDHGGRGLGHHQGHQFPEVRQVFTILQQPATPRGADQVRIEPHNESQMARIVKRSDSRMISPIDWSISRNLSESQFEMCS